MASRFRACVSCIVSVAVIIVAPPALAQAPEGVSPGATNRITEIEGRCPSFYWGAVPEAAAYELVVYRLPEESSASGAAEIELSRSDEVLAARVPGGATAWQPELAQALEPGGSYVWFVRVVSDPDTGEASEWSTGRFFEVAATPTAREIEQALEVLHRWEAADRDGSLTPSSAAATAAAPAPVAAADSGSGAGAGSSGPKSVPTATAAIRGSSPDPSGEVYGVVGISSSPDGAGIAAANLSGGPDLVLDGSAQGYPDTLLYQQRLDRPSAEAQIFNIRNSGGGGMTLKVDGIDVTTVESDLDADKLTAGTLPDGRLAGTYSQALSLTNPSNDITGDGAGLTGVDADTLDGTNGADYATDAEASAMIAVHAASADHDGRYYTQTQLNTPGTVGAVHWDNLGGVPPGFADGIDNDTQYTVGPGLIIDDGEIRFDWSVLHTRISTLDSAAVFHEHTSIAIGADGLGLISYLDSTNQDLKIAHCNDTACSTAATATLDSAGMVGAYNSVAIGADGLGLISYYDQTSGELKVAHCSNVTCSSATISLIDAADAVGLFTSIAIGADGLGLISYAYVDGMDFDLKVAHCDNTVCSTASNAIVDGDGGWDGMGTSIAIGADGLGLISYVEGINDTLKVAHCNDTVCSSATTHTLDNTNGYTSVAIGADGLGLISYYDVTNGDLKVAHCNDTICSGATTATLDSTGDVGRHCSIAIGADGLGLISYYDVTNGDLKVARCADASCTSAVTATPDNAGDVGLSTSIAIGADGLGLISYLDGTNYDLKVAHLGIGVP